MSVLANCMQHGMREVCETFAPWSGALDTIQNIQKCVLAPIRPSFRFGFCLVVFSDFSSWWFAIFPFLYKSKWKKNIFHKRRYHCISGCFCFFVLMIFCFSVFIQVEMKEKLPEAQMSLHFGIFSFFSWWSFAIFPFLYKSKWDAKSSGNANVVAFRDVFVVYVAGQRQLHRLGRPNRVSVRTQSQKLFVFLRN